MSRFSEWGQTLARPFLSCGQFFVKSWNGITRHAEVAKAAYQEQKARPKDPKRNADERAFLPAALEILETPPSPIGRWMIWSIVIFVFLAVLWSSLSHIDIVTVATGKVVPSGQVKIIQPAESGVVRAIHVEDGQRVAEDQALIELDPTDSGADMDKLTQEQMEARVEVARLRAMVEDAGYASFDRPIPVYPDFEAPEGSDPATVATHRHLMRALITEQAAKIGNLDQEALRLGSSLSRIESEVVTLENVVPMIDERASAIRKLAKKEFAPRTKLLELEQELEERKGELKAKEHEALETQAELDAVLRQRDQIQAEFLRQRYDELAEAERRLNEAEKELIKAQHSLALQTLKAPTAGVVQELKIHTIGGVVTPAQEVLKIVPEGLTLEVEAMVENKDIGFVEEDQIAEVKIETFNFTKYGVIEGKVVHVSRDAITDEEKGLVYKARVSLGENSLWVDGREVFLSSGMSVTAEIKTGRRRIIEYLLAPLLKATQESMRER